MSQHRPTPTQLRNFPASTLRIPVGPEDSGSKTEDSNSGSEAESVSTTETSSPGGCWLIKERQNVINQVIRNLCLYLDSKILQAQGNQGPCEGSHSSVIPVSEQQQTCNAQGSTSTAGASKGKSRAHDDDNSRDEEDDGDSRRRKRSRIEPFEQISKKLACPYFKRNPRKYSRWTSCPGPGWDEAHRVKAHLYKRHQLPLQCPRCWEAFRSEDGFRTHLQQDPACAVQTEQTIVDGFTKEQEKMLRSKKRSPPGTTEEDKWRDMYRILFPDDDFGLMPSPYYDTIDEVGLQNPSSDTPEQGIRDYYVFLRREMPPLVRRELDVIFQSEFQDLADNLRPRLEQMIVGMQPRLFRMFQQEEGPLAQGSGSPAAPGAAAEPPVRPGSLTPTGTVAEPGPPGSPSATDTIAEPRQPECLPQTQETAPDTIAEELPHHGPDSDAIDPAVLGTDMENLPLHMFSATGIEEGWIYGHSGFPVSSELNFEVNFLDLFASYLPEMYHVTGAPAVS